MTFKELVELLKPNLPLEIIASNNAYAIEDVSFLDDSTADYSPNVLYFTYFQNSFSLNDCPLHCIMSYDGQIPSLSNIPPNTNIAVIPQKQFFTAFNAFHFIVEKNKSILKLYDELIEKIAHSQNINEVLNFAALKIGNPLLIIDNDYTVVDYSNVYPITDAAWEDAVKCGYCKYSFIEALNNIEAFKNSPESPEPIDTTYKLLSSSRKILSKMFFKDKKVGSLLLLEQSTPINTIHFEMLKIINRAISNSIPKLIPYILSKGSIYQKILRNILIGATSAEILPLQQQIDNTSRFAVFIIKPNFISPTKDYIYRLLSSLRIHFPILPMITHEGNIVGVFILKNAANIPAHELKFLENFSQEQNSLIGISNPFYGCENIAKHYQQALSAITIGSQLQANKFLYPYSDSQFFDMLSNFPKELNLADYVHPALNILAEYDALYNNNLYQTLLVYLQSGCNVKLAAAKLFIHRNSMTYRLNKIISLTNLDLTI